MNKQNILEEYLDILVKKNTKINENIKSALNDTHEAEDAMKSRYDTKREEAEGMVEGYSIQSSKILLLIDDVKRLLYGLKNNKIENNKVLLGSIVKYVDLDNDKQEIFILVPGGDFENRGNISYLGVKTPLGKQLLGKEKGEKYDLFLPNGIKEIEIIDII